MIRINRNIAVPTLHVYVRPSVGPKGKKVTRAASELASAITFFTNRKNYFKDKKLCSKSFSFKVYKDAALATELSRVFGGKCAYCESRFAAVTPKDVEHFRPKSEIENEGQPAIRPAYFWLAGEWSNLLVSCPDCNRARKHEVPGQPKQLRLGKQTQFPLSDEVRRVRAHTGDIAAEEPYRLLLHPCLDQPEDHLTYDDEGLIYAKLPNDAKAKTSIVVYALQRKGLVEERKRVLNDLIGKLQVLRALATEFNALDAAAGPAARQAKRDVLGQQMFSISSMFTANAPYLGMLRDYVRRHLAALTDVTRAGVDLQRLIAP